MTSIYDSPIGTRAGSAPPGAPPAGWPAPGSPGGPGGPYGPYGYGGGGGPSGPARRVRRKFLIFLYVIVIGLASFWGLQVSQGTSQQGALSNSQIAARVNPGLVDIVTTLGYRQAQAAGTGMVLTSSGEVLTNNHVIEGATSIEAVNVGNGHSYRATVVGYDRGHDVAVLQLRGASGLQTVPTGNSARAGVGEKVVALGNAGGRGGTPSLVSGSIVSLGESVTAADAATKTTERLTGMIGHNAPIKPGDSGGPLVSRSGQVVGMNTAANAEFTMQGQAQAFAIPINRALSIADRIESGQGSATVHVGATGFIGVGVDSAHDARLQGVPAGSGVLIGSVFSGSPASHAGLTAGDVIVSAGGRQVGSPEALQSVLQGHHPGDRVGLTWIDQGGLHHSATVTLINGPAG